MESKLDDHNSVWVFHGTSGRFTSAVFTQKAFADEWILRNQLSGVLTRYPLDTGCYEWALEQGFYKPDLRKPVTPDFIGRFSSASQEHYHYEQGLQDGKS